VHNEPSRPMWRRAVRAIRLGREESFLASGWLHKASFASAVGEPPLVEHQDSCKVVRQAVDLLGCWRREAAIRCRIGVVASTD
jgi:hypothetical protein